MEKDFSKSVDSNNPQHEKFAACDDYYEKIQRKKKKHFFEFF